ARLERPEARLPSGREIAFFRMLDFAIVYIAVTMRASFEWTTTLVCETRFVKRSTHSPSNCLASTNIALKRCTAHASLRVDYAKSFPCFSSSGRLSGSSPAEENHAHSRHRAGTGRLVLARRGVRASQSLHSFGAEGCWCGHRAGARSGPQAVGGRACPP